MKTILISLSRVRHHPDNPRTRHDVEAIMKSYSEFGELQPIVIWSKKNYVIVGNGRLEAAKRLGLKQIHAVRADHLSKEKATAYMIADNKLGDQSEFDWQKLAELVKGLDEKGVDLAATGFQDYELEPLMQADWQPPEVGDMPEVDGGERKLSFSTEQWEIIDMALNKVREYEGYEDITETEGIIEICREYEG